MFYAVEPATGREVSANLARAARIYRCPTCGARVSVRRGSERAAHFAHLQGVANADCENYTPSRIEYRRRPPGEGRIVGPSIATSYLSLSLSAERPRLAYWLPPAPGATWTGAVEVEAFGTSRQIRAANLRNGQRVEFPLVDGQWIVSDTGDVADEYLELIARGRQSLDVSGAVFDASSAVGRQVLPGQSVAYGQSLHWVSRNALDLKAPGVRLCLVQKLAIASGWHIYKIQLPEGAYSGDEFLELVQWLERRIRPARPKVWIETPWARATTETGFQVYDPSDGDLIVRADRSVDIRIADARTGRSVLERLSQQHVRAQDLEQGTYDLFVNDLLHETFVIKVVGRRGSSAVLVRIDALEPIALPYAQPELDKLIASGKPSVSLHVAWEHPAVGAIVSFGGEALRHDGGLEAQVLMSPGMRLDVANLGSLEWPIEAAVPTSQTKPIPAQLLERAAWLLSVAETAVGRAGERVKVPEVLRREAVFRSLARAVWCLRLGPQVRAMSASLSEWS